MLPDDEAGYNNIDDQFFFGDTGRLAKPVVQESAIKTRVYLPDDQVYYEYFNYTTYRRKGHHEIRTGLETISVFI